MVSRRTAKVARAILEAVSSTVLHGLKDPRVKNVTVIHVDVSEDIRTAKVYVSVMGTEKVQALTMRGLKAARGFLQSKVADRLQTKNTPILTFILDQSVKRSAASSALIRQALVEGRDPDTVFADAEDSFDSPTLERPAPSLPQDVASAEKPEHDLEETDDEAASDSDFRPTGFHPARERDVS